MKLVTIDYAEFKRLVKEEFRLKDKVAQLEDEIEDLKAENHYLDLELHEEKHRLLTDEEEAMLSE